MAAPTPDWDKLFAAAQKARERAYAPYSNFKVGAAILFEDGSAITGCNVENASYGLSMCAERNAIAQSVLERKSKPVAVAIIADSKEPTPPCGACRQVLAEFAPPDLQVGFRNLEGKTLSSTLAELLPHAFHKGFF